MFGGSSFGARFIRYLRSDERKLVNIDLDDFVSCEDLRKHNGRGLVQESCFCERREEGYAHLLQP